VPLSGGLPSQFVQQRQQHSSVGGGNLSPGHSLHPELDTDSGGA
jgi:hypothetical protein